MGSRILVVDHWRRDGVRVWGPDKIARLDALHAEQFDGAVKQNGDAVEDGEADGLQVAGARWVPQGPHNVTCYVWTLVNQVTSSKPSAGPEHRSSAGADSSDGDLEVSSLTVLPPGPERMF